jgi:hypothetical protein
LHYQANLVAESLVALHPLNGASLQLDLTWDPSLLTPISSSASKTEWPTTNTIGTLTVSESMASNGIYTASFPFAAPYTWTIYNDFPGVGDAKWVPRMRFQIGNQRVETSVPIVYLPDTYVSGQHPFYPKPVSYNDARWSKVTFDSRAPLAAVDATVVSASITTVPEASTAAMSGFVLLSLAALRRRK